MDKDKTSAAGSGVAPRPPLKILEALSSMRLGLSLLLLLGAVAGAGTFLSRGQTEFYRSPWFISLLTLLALNLSVCTLRRARPALAAAFRPPAAPMGKLPGRGPEVRVELPPDTPDAAATIRGLVEKRGFRVSEKVEGGVTGMAASKGNMRPLGSLLTHAGMLVIFLGALAGSVWGSSGMVFVPIGDSFRLSDAIKGGGGDLVRVEDFRIERYPDGIPSQYTSRVKVEGAEGTRHYDIAVNSPANLDGVKIFQSSWGNAVGLSVSGGSGETAAKVREGDIVAVPGTNYAVKVYRYIPNYDPAYGMNSRSPEPVNPRVVYGLYRGESRMKVGLGELKQPVDLGGGMSVTFSEAVLFTGLQVKRDPGVPVVWAGCGLLLAGIIISLYSGPGYSLWFLIKKSQGKTVVEMAFHGGRKALSRDFAGLVEEIKAARGEVV